MAVFEKGMEQLRRMTGNIGVSNVEALMQRFPALGKYVVEFGFGDIYSRPGLDLKQREMVSLASLASQGGCEAQLRFHIQASLHVGVTVDEIVEIFIQLIPHIGIPKVMNAFSVLEEARREAV